MAMKQSKLAQKRHKKKLARKNKRYQPKRYYQVVDGHPVEKPLIANTEKLEL
jgi:hypothetical protein